MLLSTIISFLMARTFHGKGYVFSIAISLLLTSFFSVGVPHYLQLGELSEAQNGVLFENPLLFSFPFYALLKNEYIGISSLRQYYQLCFFTFMFHKSWVLADVAAHRWLGISLLDYFLYFSFFLTLNIVGAIIGYWTSKRTYIDVRLQKMKQKFGHIRRINRAFATIFLSMGVFLVFYTYYIRTISSITEGLYISYSWMTLYLLMSTICLHFGLTPVLRSFKPQTYKLTKAAFLAILVGTLLFIGYFALFDFAFQDLRLEYGEGWLHLDTPVALISFGSAMVIAHETFRILRTHSETQKQVGRVNTSKLWTKAMLPIFLAMFGTFSIVNVYIIRSALFERGFYQSYPLLSLYILAGAASFLFAVTIAFETLAEHMSRGKKALLSMFLLLVLLSISSLLLYDAYTTLLLFRDTMSYDVPPFLGIPQRYHWIPIYIVVALVSLATARAIAYKAFKTPTDKDEDGFLY